VPAAFSFPIANWWTVAVIGALALAALAAAILWHVRACWRLSLGLLSVLLTVLAAAAGINAYYLYFRQFDELFGTYAADQASIDVLTSTVVPDHGQVVSLHVPNTASGFDARDANVYLPPAWFQRPRPRLPVIMLFHGEPGSPDDWTRCCLADLTADRFARAHGGVAPILVMPDINGGFTRDTECVNASQGNAETYLTVDVRNWVIRTFNARSDAPSWALGGLSEGGMCAMVLTLRHPGLFRTFMNSEGLAGPQFGDNTVEDLFDGNRAAYRAHLATVLLRERRYPEIGGWFQVGTDDSGPYEAAKVVVPLAEKAGIEICLVIVPGGGHTASVWTATLQQSFDWMAARLGLTTQTPAMTAVCENRP
jgi:enterochelin esterase-like enzyme